MHFKIIFLWFLLFPVLLFSQSEAIQQTLENLSENQDILLDYSKLIEELEMLESHPINLNSDQIYQLHRLFLLNEYQLENLKSYILENDHLLSVYELLLIDGFTRENIETILPFIEVKPLEKMNLPKLNQLIKYGRHDLFLRYQRKLQTQNGYQNFENGDNTNSYYLGNADKYYVKYKFSYSRQIQWGFTTEKDAGELFYKEPENKQLQSEIDNYFHKGFDFTSLHLYGQDFGLIKQIALGDYHLLFGQGLTIWTGLSFGKSSDAVQLKRFESYIKPYTSSNENGFLRGAAIHLGQKHWSTVLFYSKNKQDATLQIDENGNEYVSTLLYTGLHRTSTELSKKAILDIQVFGGRFKYTFKTVSLGFTAFNTSLSKDLISSYTPENLFDLRGNKLTNYGIDYAFKWWKANFYGEVALSSAGGKAIISGISLPFNSRMKLSLLYRNYERDYQNLFASALAENSSPNNEKGFYAGTNVLLSKKLRLQAYVDFFSFPWLKYKQDSPSHGIEYRAQLFYDYNQNIRMHIKFKYKQKDVNLGSENTGEVNFLKDETKSGFQYQINYSLNERFELRNRIEFSRFLDGNQEKSLGFMLYQDINYHSVNQRFGSNTRLAVFNTDSFSSAIYAYENDVLYAFSIPAYFGQGIRFYQLLNYDLSQKIKCWFRYSLSYFPDQESIGSGLDEISGSIKSEIKLQLRIKI
ncbi:MAG: hypothetical protein PF484_11140 [Bacteroidales bacterium]|jgi:hypothetical protein|nr:hypothetical protein [Bacteroidales bacterium]